MEMPKDAFVLFSCVNSWLRDFYGSLEELCEDKGFSKEELLEILSEAGFSYDREKNRFI